MKFQQEIELFPFYSMRNQFLSYRKEISVINLKETEQRERYWLIFDLQNELLDLITKLEFRIFGSENCAIATLTNVLKCESEKSIGIR